MTTIEERHVQTCEERKKAGHFAVTFGGRGIKKKKGGSEAVYGSA